jgi:hypothetical protein
MVVGTWFEGALVPILYDELPQAGSARPIHGLHAPVAERKKRSAPPHFLPADFWGVIEIFLARAVRYTAE